MDDNVELTPRDREYLRGIFVLKGNREPVGPSKLAHILDVSKVAVLEKMRRLEAMGYGDYVHRRGLLLNEKGTEVVQKDIQRHHIMERYFQDNFGMESTEACRESSAMDPFISENFMRNISTSLGRELSCECGCCIDDHYDPEDLYDCHWFKRQFKV